MTLGFINSGLSSPLKCARELGADHKKSDGGGGSKNRAGETEKKIRAPEKFEQKNSCRDFSIGKIIS